MKKAGTLRSQAGFSLVELMVVVAIIGVLAAMSAGQVQKQIAKARQSEAKTNLASLYTSESAFKAEYNTYCTDFDVIKLAYSGQMRYDVGFAADAVPKATAATFGYTGTAGSGKFKASDWCAAGVCSLMADAVAPAGTSANQNAFIAVASSHVYNSGSTDTWQITEGKMLSQTSDGIP